MSFNRDVVGTRSTEGIYMGHLACVMRNLRPIHGG